MIKRFLLHERLVVRFLALLGVVSMVFLVIWALSYAFLPEGLLKGRTGAQALAGDDLTGGSAWLEWLRIFVINLGVMLLVLVPANLLRTEGNYPLGYVSVSMVAAVCAVTLGTNSFTLSMEGRMPPTLAVFGSSGVYEIAAYVLAVAATVSIARWRIAGNRTEPVAPTRDRSVVRQRNSGIALAVATLAIACGWEAYRVAQVLAP
jgi:hypothetical protein